VTLTSPRLCRNAPEPSLASTPPPFIGMPWCAGELRLSSSPLCSAAKWARPSCSVGAPLLHEPSGEVMLADWQMEARCQPCQNATARTLPRASTRLRRAWPRSRAVPCWAGQWPLGPARPGHRLCEPGQGRCSAWALAGLIQCTGQAAVSTFSPLRKVEV
jgi:hypothetical protein